MEFPTDGPTVAAQTPKRAEQATTPRKPLRSSASSRGVAVPRRKSSGNERRSTRQGIAISTSLATHAHRVPASRRSTPDWSRFGEYWSRFGEFFGVFRFPFLRPKITQKTPKKCSEIERFVSKPGVAGRSPMRHRLRISAESRDPAPGREGRRFAGNLPRPIGCTSPPASMLATASSYRLTGLLRPATMRFPL